MGERYRLNPVASTTDSGIEVRKWIELLMVALLNKVITNAPIFLYEEGKPVRIEALDVIFREVLK